MLIELNVSGSQAVSSTNLTSDDTLSIRSISVDETPDFDSKIKQNSQNNKSSENNENKNESNDSHNITTSKTPALTPGSRNRINPFMKDYENEDFFNDKRLMQRIEPEKSVIKEKTNLDSFENNSKTESWVDPLGCLPVQNQTILQASQNNANNNFLENKPQSITTNGQSTNEEDETSAVSDQSNNDLETHGSNEGSSVGSSGGYDSPYEGSSIVKMNLPPGKVCLLQMQPEVLKK